MTAKAPTLAWLLTALACLLAGMAITEGRNRAAALPAQSPVGIVVTVEVAFAQTATPEPTAPIPTPPPVGPTATPPAGLPDHSAASFPTRTPPSCEARSDA